MTRALDAVILAVGSEMLTPWRTDTNSLFITGVLNELGLDVAYKAVVGDDRAALEAQVAHALAHHRILVLTGGLGPTDDDLTREAVAAQLRLPLSEDVTIVEGIRARFATRGLAMPEVNRRQAQVPAGATVLENVHGSAPGLLIEHDSCVIVLLPGPQREMQPMMTGVVRARLARMAGPRFLLRRALRVTGRTESRLEELVQPIYAPWLDLNPPIQTTILATPGSVEIHLSVRVIDEQSGAAALDVAAHRLIERLGPDVAGASGQSVEQTVGDQLRARGWRIALAESCTGGLATSRLTDVAGSSDYVDRSVVAYSNAAKAGLLGVPEPLLARHGAVSEPVARAMAEGLLVRSGADVVVAITGIAGPGGGSADKPVGTVWFAVAIAGPRDTQALVCRFIGGRELVKTFAAVTALDLVRRRLLDAPWDIDWARR